MSGIFDGSIFDSAIFDTGSVVGGGQALPDRRLERHLRDWIEDDAEALLLLTP